MLQLNDQTPFHSGLFCIPASTGAEQLVVVVKASFQIGAQLEPATPQEPLKLADVLYEPTRHEPATIVPPSIRSPSDVGLPKPGTDVLLMGQAHAPGGRPTAQLDAALTVAGRTLTVRVRGDRVWTGALAGAVATPPQPFICMPLRYENAFGGAIHRAPNQLFCEERNPVGVGLTEGLSRDQWRGRPLPNLEHPGQPLLAPGERPDPVGFGAIAAAWLPRRTLAGTYDARWARERAPLLPSDFDPRFLHVAHPSLIWDQPLRGGEPISLVNLTRDGSLELILPHIELAVDVRLGGTSVQPPMQIDTVIIEPEEQRLTVVMRGIVSCDKRLLQVQRVDIGLRTLTCPSPPPSRRLPRC